MSFVSSQSDLYFTLDTKTIHLQKLVSIIQMNLLPSARDVDAGTTSLFDNAKIQTVSVTARLVSVHVWGRCDPNQAAEVLDLLKFAWEVLARTECACTALYCSVLCEFTVWSIFYSLTLSHSMWYHAIILHVIMRCIKSIKFFIFFPTCVVFVVVNMQRSWYFFTSSVNILITSWARVASSSLTIRPLSWSTWK